MISTAPIHKGSGFTVMVVDDEPVNLTVMSDLLQQEYKVLVANSGRRAQQLIETQPLPDLILLDIMMPQMSGLEVCRWLKQRVETQEIPVIFVTAVSDAISEEEGFEAGGIDYITKPIVPPILLARVRAQIALYDEQRTLEQRVTERTAQLNHTRLMVVHRLGRAAEYRDNETGNHVIRMSYTARLLAEALGEPKEWIDDLFIAAPMHDVGKIGIPDSILLKQGRLNAQEWAIMRQHPTIGATILGDPEDSSMLKLAVSVALNHHERWDGSGYPAGLVGVDIPLEARIVALADVVDALLSKRPYKEPWSVDRTLEYIAAEAARQFDPELVPVLLGQFSEVEVVMQRFSDNREKN